jgi:hypothetical protein
MCFDDKTVEKSADVTHFSVHKSKTYYSMADKFLTLCYNL